jgi:nucleotide-binding universal stress UspA family protein
MPVIDVRAEIALDKILLATDFSPAAEIAASYAIALARRFSSTLELTTVIDLSVVAPAGDVLVEPALDAIRRSGQEGLQQLAASIPGVKVNNRPIEGLLTAPLILEAANESKADLIVMGTTAKHGLEKFVLGSTAEEVIRQAACPVLTVGPHVSKAADAPLAFERIIYTTDFSARAAKAASYALSFAQDSGANLYLCHVIDAEERSIPGASDTASITSLKKLIPESAYDWCNPEYVVEHGKAAEVILELSSRVKADLIVLGARSLSFWLSYVATGLTPALLAKAKCPVLTVC